MVAWKVAELQVAESSSGSSRSDTESVGAICSVSACSESMRGSGVSVRGGRARGGKVAEQAVQ